MRINYIMRYTLVLSILICIFLLVSGCQKQEQKTYSQQCSKNSDCIISPNCCEFQCISKVGTTYDRIYNTLLGTRCFCGEFPELVIITKGERKCACEAGACKNLDEQKAICEEYCAILKKKQANCISEGKSTCNLTAEWAKYSQPTNKDHTMLGYNFAEFCIDYTCDLESQ